MTRIITHKNFDNPCPVCKGVIFNTASGKCSECLRRQRIAAVALKCKGQKQTRDESTLIMTEEERSSKHNRKEWLYMGHPELGPKVQYENADTFGL